MAYESKLQRDGRSLLEKNGFLVIRYSGTGNGEDSAIPDTLCINRQSKLFFVEFKDIDKDLSAIQKAKRALLELFAPIYKIDSIEDLKKLITVKKEGESHG